jgi:putative oxidoreductase
VQRLFSAFPAGRPGAGLLLLRSAVGLAALAEGAAVLAAGNEMGMVMRGADGTLAIASGTLLLIGFLTPIAAAVSVLAVAIGVFVAPLPDAALASVFVVIVSVAIVLLGPGAFSLDSHLFGRREIVIPQRKNA